LPISIKNETETQIHQLGQVLALLLQRLTYNQQVVGKFEQFLLDFPLLCCKLYEFLFKKVQFTSRIENFELTLTTLTKFFFNQMLQFAIISTDDEGTNRKNLVSNTTLYNSTIIQLLFGTLPMYEECLKQLSQDLINIVIDEIIQGHFCNSK